MCYVSAEGRSREVREDEVLVVARQCGGRWIFIGLESMEPDSLKVAHKEFNKPEEYATILNTLAKYDLYAITSFIYGMEADEPGVSKKTVHAIDAWPQCPIAIARYS